MKKTLFGLGFAGLLSGVVSTSPAANPILHGFADPAMRVWNDRMYLAVGKDKSRHQGFCHAVLGDLFVGGLGELAAGKND